MPLSNVDPAFPHIERLGKEIQKLKAEFLKTARFAARESVRTYGNFALQQVNLLPPATKLKFRQQLLVEVTETRSKIKTSQDPLPLAEEFREKCNDNMQKLGITFIDEGL
jgi:hypothetical protein